MFLGHVISAEGVSPNPEMTAVTAFLQPAYKKAVRRSLGLSAYYRRFLEDLFDIAEPLTRLTKDDVPYIWQEEQYRAFNGRATGYEECRYLFILMK